MSNQQSPSNKEKRHKIRRLLTISPELSDRQIAKMAGGVSHNTVAAVRDEMVKKSEFEHLGIPDKNAWMQHPLIKNGTVDIKKLSEEALRAIKAPGVLDTMMQRGWTSPRYTQRKLNEERIERKNNVNVRVTPTFFNSSVADIRDEMPSIPDRSIKLICTDLPYQGKYVDVYRSLSYLAGRVLVEDGGVLVVMTGTIHLPLFLSALCECEELSYVGTIAVIANSAGGQYRGISTHWKPVIILSKGKHKGDLISDVFHAPPDPEGKDRKHHVHGQSEEIFTQLIKKFSDPLDFVADFCCGGGTTAVCALRLGRRVFASDINKSAVKTTQRRVASLLEEMAAEYELEAELFRGQSPIYRDKNRKDNDQ